MTSSPAPTRHQRPRLIVLSPFIHYACVGYVVLNASFALSLWYAPNRATFIVENGWANQYFWSIVFAALAVSMAFGMVAHYNRLVKASLIAGLAVKFVWWFAFIYLAFKTGFLQNVSALGFWFFVSMIQAACIMLFPPTEKEIRKEVSERIVHMAMEGGDGK